MAPLPARRSVEIEDEVGQFEVVKGIRDEVGSLRPPSEFRKLDLSGSAAATTEQRSGFAQTLSL
jgi:hypothetical protein